MSRLIDGKIQALPMSNYILERKETFIEVLQKGDNDFLFAMLMDYFDKQPTAYVIDNVIREIDDDIAYIYADDTKEKFVHYESVASAIRKGGLEYE